MQSDGASWVWPEAFRFYVFVYGTLKKGGIYHQQLCRPWPQQTLPAFACGQLYHLQDCGYPALLEGEGWVQGELLAFNTPELMADLDRLEGYVPGTPLEANDYYRKQVMVYDLQKQPRGQADIYYMMPQRLESYQPVALPDGWWPLHLSGKRTLASLSQAGTNASAET